MKNEATLQFIVVKNFQPFGRYRIKKMQFY